MKKVLITGAKGFIGKNLVYELRNKKQYDIFEFDRNNTIEELTEYVCEADYIYHLAGINRPENIEEYDQGNRGFTQELISIIQNNNINVPIVMTSSIQAELDNSYGISKRKAEELIYSCQERCRGEVYIYRLPNVFGKWSRAFYNSVVATFCYSIGHDMEITVDDPEKIMTLVYIDDVIESFIGIMEDKGVIQKDGYCVIDKVYQCKLQELADTICSFRISRNSLIVQNNQNEFVKKLYATYTSYLSIENFQYSLEKKEDSRGYLAEFLKAESFGQIFVSKTKPGVVRGNHWHHTKVEKFLVISGTALISFRKIYENEVVEYVVSGDEMKPIDIPVGYTHLIKNIGQDELITIFYANELFDQTKPDTYYMEVYDAE